MTLYLYKIGRNVPVMTIENVTSYTADRITAEDGVSYGPFAADCELSSLPDCSEALRRAWTAANPDQETRTERLETILEEVETLLAALLFGGDTV